MSKFTDAPEVETIAAELIARYHPRLSSANIRYLFKDGDWEAKGKTVLAQAKLATGLFKHLTSLDFTITVNKLAWEAVSEAKRAALIDHELCHCDAKVDIRTGEIIGWEILPHDLDEFAAVVERHGLWQQDVKTMARAMQPHLFDEQGRPSLRVVGE